MTCFETREEYVAAQLDAVNERYGVTGYELLSDGRSAHIIEPSDVDGRTVYDIRKAVARLGGSGSVREDGGVMVTNEWERSDEFIMRVELVDEYKELFAAIDRVTALPYFDQENVFLREPSTGSRVTCEVVIEYEREHDDRNGDKNGVLSSEVWGVLRDFETGELTVEEDVVTVVLHPRDEQFHLG